MARLLVPSDGAVLLDGAAIAGMRTGDVARVVGLLPQSPLAPDSITVGDLVGRGRYPHQGWFRSWTDADAAAVDDALAVTGTTDLVARRVSELSGGQRQRVWIAMALAQQTDILLLDEPTTFLDINYQIEVLDLLVRAQPRSRAPRSSWCCTSSAWPVRYADHLIAMKDGAIVAEGEPAEVVTAEIVLDVFGLRCDVIDDPHSGRPLVIPLGRHGVRR